MRERRGFWKVGIARNAVFSCIVLLSTSRKGTSEERAGAECASIWKSKSLKIGGLGTLKLRSLKLHPVVARERFGSQNR